MAKSTMSNAAESDVQPSKQPEFAASTIEPVTLLQCLGIPETEADTRAAKLLIEQITPAELRCLLDHRYIPVSGKDWDYRIFPCLPWNIEILDKGGNKIDRAYSRYSGINKIPLCDLLASVYLYLQTSESWFINKMCFRVRRR